MNGLPAPSPRKYLEREMDDAAREFYRRWRAGGQLTSTSCDRCEAVAFPPRERCARCGASTRWVPLPARGTLYAFTTQEGALRFRAPWVLALAEFDGAVLPGVLDEPFERLRIGLSVTASPHPEEETGLTLVRFELC